MIGSTPYISLQLQSVALSFSVFDDNSLGALANPEGLNSTAFWVAAGLALFTILFGTRNLDANEQHHGVVTAIAVEAVVKLVALLAVGIFVVWGVASVTGSQFEPSVEWETVKSPPAVRSSFTQCGAVMPAWVVLKLEAPTSGRP